MEPPYRWSSASGEHYTGRVILGGGTFRDPGGSLVGAPVGVSERRYISGCRITLAGFRTPRVERQLFPFREFRPEVCEFRGKPSGDSFVRRNIPRVRLP